MGCRGALSLHKKRVFQKLINGTQIARIAQIYHIVIQFIICVIRVICVPFGDLTHLLFFRLVVNIVSFQPDEFAERFELIQVHLSGISYDDIDHGMVTDTGFIELHDVLHIHRFA